MGSLLWCAALLLAAAPDEAKLHGTWGLGGQPFMVLSAGGKGSMDGEPLRWALKGGKLLLTDDSGESESVAFTLEGDRLTLQLEGAAITLERQGKANAAGPPAPEATPNPGRPAPQGGAPGAASPGSGAQEPLGQLLLSSAWCSFSYSNGTTRTSRVQFLPNGTWSSGSNRETSWSGQNGSFYGQNSSGEGGQWAVKGGQLLMSAPPEVPALTPLPLTVTRNSNGYPILTADGKEYSQCQ